MSTPTTEYYQIQSNRHRNLHNLCVTVNGDKVIHLYTDGTGLMREIRDGEGHPFISKDVAKVFLEHPADSGWLITPLAADEPEPPEEIVPIDVGDTGTITFTSDRLAGRLREVILTLKEKEALLAEKDNTILALQATIRSFDIERENLQKELQQAQMDLNETQLDRPVIPEETQQPTAPAPMIEKGKFVKAKRGRPTRLSANDASVTTLLEAQANNEPFQGYGSGDLNDIPQMEE